MKILLVQPRQVGDILLTTPVARYLKQLLPQSELHFLTEPMGKSVLETNPYIDKLFVYDRKEPWEMIRQVRAQRFDAVLDFMNNPRTSLLTFLSGAKQKVGWRQGIRWVFYNTRVPNPSTPEYVPVRKLRLTKHWLKTIGMEPAIPVRIRPEIFLKESDEQKAAQWMKEVNTSSKGFAVIAPASRRPLRIWTKEGYRNTALYIRNKYKKDVFLAWGPGEEAWMEEIRKGHENDIRLLPFTSLREMAAIFRQSTLVLTNDAGPMHVSVSVDTPTVTLYGPTRPIDWNPSLTDHGKRNIIVQEPNLKDLKEERVFEACDRILAGDKND